MKTINYITYDSWWDTDKTILPDLCKEYNVNVIVLNPRHEDLKYQVKDRYNAKSMKCIEQPCRDRDIRSILTAICAFIYLLRISKKDDVKIFIPGKNPFFLLLFYIFISSKNTLIAYHNYIEHVDKRSSLVSKIKHLYLKKYQNFLFYSESQVNLFNADFPNKSSYLLNMPLKDFGAPTKQRSHDEFTFLFFGLIRDYKRLDLFIKAANLLNNKKCKFIIAGKCDDWNKYEKLIDDKTLFDLHLRFIDDNEVADFFYNSDFLVLPYDDATQSGPLMIALNYGLPVIASDQVSFKKIICNEQNGFIFKKGDYKDLANKMEQASMLSQNELLTFRESQMSVKSKYVKDNDILTVVKHIIENF